MPQAEKDYHPVTGLPPRERPRRPRRSLALLLGATFVFFCLTGAAPLPLDEQPQASGDDLGHSLATPCGGHPEPIENPDSAGRHGTYYYCYALGTTC